MSTPNARSRFAVGAALALVVAFAPACSGTANGLPRTVSEASGRAPSVAGPAINGDLPNLGGKVLVVNFWNPYCPPCRVEEPVLERAHRGLAGRGVVVLGIHYTGGQWPTSVGDARSFLRAAGATYPVVGDPEGRLASGFGIRAIPSTVIVDAHGEMRFRVLGRLRTEVLDDLVGRVLSARS
ncbi:MAG TPA: TlpA disulfide reductase family protein [Actinomycetota bacterium]